VARAMADTIRPGDLIARYGGEEFALLLPDTTAEEALAVAERLRQAIAAIDLSHLPGSPAAISASLGVATRGAGDRTTGEELIARADAALYAAKNEGRNRVCHAADLPREEDGDRLSA